MFDVTATSNHWVLNPGRNLGLQLALESAQGESVYFFGRREAAGGHFVSQHSKMEDKEDKVPSVFLILKKHRLDNNLCLTHSCLLVF